MFYVRRDCFWSVFFKINNKRSDKVRWFLQSGDKRAASCMQKRHRCPNWTSSEPVELKGISEEFTVHCKGKTALIHVQEHTQTTFLLEWPVVFDALRITSVPQLAHPVVAEP